jgi:AMP-binding enzyme C-terminal domain
VKELRDWVGEQLGAIAKPDEIRFADNLPKTRSGKIMRRLLKAVARGEEITQDVSTLENPAILDQLRGVDAGAPASRPARKSVPRKSTSKKTGASARSTGRKSHPKDARTASSKRTVARKSVGKANSRRAKPAKRAAVHKAARTSRGKSGAKRPVKRPMRRR